LAESYNSSQQAEFNDELLQSRLKDGFGVSVGTFNLAKITTKTGDGYELSSDGNYINNRSKNSVAGYYRYRSRGRSELHVSPKYTNGTDVEFRATAGHELIHAYHGYRFGVNFNRTYSERVAYKYTYDTYMMAGQAIRAFGVLATGIDNSYFGRFPSKYRVPRVLGW
jgi:hypothetical protein